MSRCPPTAASSASPGIPMLTSSHSITQAAQAVSPSSLSYLSGCPTSKSSTASSELHLQTPASPTPQHGQARCLASPSVNQVRSSSPEFCNLYEKETPLGSSIQPQLLWTRPSVLEPAPDSKDPVFGGHAIGDQRDAIVKPGQQGSETSYAAPNFIPSVLLPVPQQTPQKNQPEYVTSSIQGWSPPSATNIDRRNIAHHRASCVGSSAPSMLAVPPPTPSQFKSTTGNISANYSSDLLPEPETSTAATICPYAQSNASAVTSSSCSPSITKHQSAAASSYSNVSAHGGPVRNSANNRHRAIAAQQHPYRNAVTGTHQASSTSTSPTVSEGKFPCRTTASQQRIMPGNALGLYLEGASPAKQRDSTASFSTEENAAVAQFVTTAKGTYLEGQGQAKQESPANSSSGQNSSMADFSMTADGTQQAGSGLQEASELDRTIDELLQLSYELWGALPPMPTVEEMIDEWKTLCWERPQIFNTGDDLCMNQNELCVAPKDIFPIPASTQSTLTSWP